MYVQKNKGVSCEGLKTDRKGYDNEMHDKSMDFLIDICCNIYLNNNNLTHDSAHYLKTTSLS